MIAHGEEQIAVARLHDAAAEMVAARGRALLAEDDLHVVEPRRLAVVEPRARQRGAAAAVEPARHSRNRSSCSMRSRGRARRRAARPDRWRTTCGTPATGGDSLPSRVDDAQPAGPFGDEHPAVGQESETPGMIEPARDRLDRSDCRRLDGKSLRAGFAESATAEGDRENRTNRLIGESFRARLASRPEYAKVSEKLRGARRRSSSWRSEQRRSRGRATSVAISAGRVPRWSARSSRGATAKPEDLVESFEHCPSLNMQTFHRALVPTVAYRRRTVAKLLGNNGKPVNYG